MKCDVDWVEGEMTLIDFEGPTSFVYVLIETIRGRQLFRKWTDNSTLFACLESPLSSPLYRSRFPYMTQFNRLGKSYSSSTLFIIILNIAIKLFKHENAEHSWMLSSSQSFIDSTPKYHVGCWLWMRQVFSFFHHPSNTTQVNLYDGGNSLSYFSYP